MCWFAPTHESQPPDERFQHQEQDEEGDAQVHAVDASETADDSLPLENQSLRFIPGHTDTTWKTSPAPDVIVSEFPDPPLGGRPTLKLDASVQTAPPR